VGAKRVCMRGLCIYKSSGSQMCPVYSRVWCSVLQCVAVCRCVLQAVAVWCSALQRVANVHMRELQHSDMLCVKSSVLQCVAVCCSVFRCVAVCRSVLQCVAVCCSVLQRVAACCSVYQDAYM